MKIKLFGREPAVWLASLQAALGVAITFGVHLSTDQAGTIVAVAGAVFGVVMAILTRPVAPAAFTALVTAAAALLVAFHFHVSPEAVGSVNVAVLAVLTLLTRGQVSPTAARPAKHAAPADSD